MPPLDLDVHLPAGPDGLHDLDAATLDALPIGAIELDARGRILRYNRTEGRLAGLEPRRQVGRHFFEEVAPCTKVQTFHGRFLAGVAKGALDATFQFRFAFAPAPREVTVRLYYSPRTATVWVLVADRTERAVDAA